MGKRRLIQPMDYSPQDRKMFAQGSSRPNVPLTPGNEGITFNPNRMEDLSVAFQSGYRNWSNNLSNHIDEIHKSEVDGKKLMLQREIDLIEDDEDMSMESKFNKIKQRQIELLELDKRKAEYQQEIDDTPVSKKFLGMMDAINIQGSASFLSGDHINQLSEDLAGTLMYQIPQFGVQAASMAANYIPVAGPFISAATTAASTYYFRKQESLAEIGGAYEERMAKWDAEFFKNNPKESTDSPLYKDMRAAAEKQARAGIGNLYDKNMSLMAQDIMSTALLLGRFGGTGKLFNTGNRMLNKGLHFGTNLANQYYSEGVYEEGSQYNWQKQYVSGKLDAEKSGLRNWTDAFTSDLGEVASAYFPNLIQPETLDLVLDKNFHDAVERGGKAAMLFGGGMSMMTGLVDQYKYGQVKKHLAENIDVLKDQESSKYNLMMYKLFDRGKIEEVNSATDRMVRKGELTEEQGATIKRDIKEKGEIFDKLDSIFYTRGASLNNRTDGLTRLDAWLAASKIVDLKKEAEAHETKVNKLRQEMTIGDEEILGKRFEDAMKAKSDDIQERIKFQKDKFKKITRGNTRSINAVYKAEMAKAKNEKEKATATLKRDIALYKRNLEYYGDEELNRTMMNNFAVQEQIHKNPEKALDILKNNQAAKNYLLPDTLKSIREKVQPLIDKRDGLLKQLETYNNLAEQAEYDGNVESLMKYTGLANNIQSKLDGIPGNLDNIFSKHTSIDKKSGEVEVFTPEGTQKLKIENGRIDFGSIKNPNDKLEAIKETALVTTLSNPKEGTHAKSVTESDAFKDSVAVADEVSTNPNFSNLDAVNIAISNLTAFSDYLKGNDEYLSKELNSFVKELKDSLTKQQKAVEKRQNSNIVKSKAALVSMKARFNSIFNNEDVKSILDNSSNKDVAVILEKKDMSIVDYLSVINLLTDTEKEELNTVAKLIFDDAILDFEKASTPGLKNQLVLSMGEDSYNISFNLPTILNNALTIPNSADLLNSGYDLQEVKKLVKSGKTGTQDIKRALAQLETLEVMRAMEDLVYYTSSPSIDIATLNSGLERILNTSDIIPNGQQFEALIRMIFSHPKTGSSFFLSGFAGSGKSVTIGNFITMLKAWGFEKEDFVVTAKLEEIRKSLASKTGIEPVPFDNLDVKGKSYLIIDEAAYLSKEDLDAMEALKIENPKLRILYVGDPNQLNADNSMNSPMLDMVKASKGKITTAPALNIINRTNILPVRDYQSRYIGAEFNNSRVVGKNNSGMISKDNKLKGTVVLKLEEAQKWFESEATPGAIVITDEKHFEKAKKTFGEGNVFLSNQVQGMEYDTVYIYMPTVPSSKDLIGRNNYSKQMYVASTRAKNAIVHITEGVAENIEVAEVPVAEGFNKKQAKKEFKSFLASNAPHKVVAKEESPESILEEQADESTENPQEVIDKETEKEKEIVETETQVETVTEESSKVGNLVPKGTLGEEDAGLEIQSFPQEAVAEVTEVEESTLSLEVPTGAQFAYKKKPGKNSWRLELAYSAVLGAKNKIADFVGRSLSKGQNVYGDIVVSKVSKDGKDFINIDIKIEGKRAGGMLYRTKAERDALVDNPNVIFDENHKAVNERVDSLDLKVGESVSIGRVKIDTVHKRGNVHEGKPFNVTESYINDVLIPKMNRSFFSAGTENASGKIIDWTPILYTTRDAKGSVEDLINKYPAKSSERLAIIKAVDAMEANYTKLQGRPYLVFLGELNSGSHIAHVIPMQPRKLKRGDSIIKALTEAVEAKDNFVDMIKENFKEVYSEQKSVEEMFAEASTALIADPSKNTDEIREAGHNLTTTFNKTKPLLTMLAEANAQIRDTKSKERHNLTWTDLENIISQFDSDGNSTFFKEGKVKFKNEDSKGLYLPIQVGTLADLKSNITLKNSKRSHLGHAFTSTTTDLTGASVWAKDLELNEPVATEESLEIAEDIETIDEGTTDTMESLLDEDLDEMFYSSNSDSLVTPIGQAEAKALFKRLLPWASEEQITFATNAMVKELTGGKSQWGRYRRNEVLLATLPNGTVYKELLMHEVFHKVFAEAFTEEERQALFRAAEVEYPQTQSMDSVEMEEFLADKFMTYQEKPNTIASRVVHFFKKLARALNFFRANYNSIDQAFEEIYKGKYQKWTKPKRITPRYFGEVKSDFGSGIEGAEAMKRAQTIISKLIAVESKSNIEGNVPSDIRDTLDKTVKVLRSRYNVLQGKVDSGQQLTSKEENQLNFYHSLGFLKDKKLRGLKFLIQETTGLTELTVSERDGVPYMSFETQDHAYLDNVEEAPEEERRKILDNSWSKDDDFVSLEDSLTSTVKLFVSLIPEINSSGKVTGVVNKKFLYKALLDAFQGYSLLPTIDGEVAGKYDNLISFLDMKMETLGNAKLKGAYNLMKTMAIHAQKEQSSPYVKFLSPNEVAVATTVGVDHAVRDVQSLTNKELRGSTDFVILKRNSTESSATFAKRALLKASLIEGVELTKEDSTLINEAFKSVVNRDTLNAIVTNFQSPYKKNLMTGYNNIGVKGERRMFSYNPAFIDDYIATVKKDLKDPHLFNAIKQSEIEEYIDSISDTLKKDEVTHADAMAIFNTVFEDTAYEETDYNIKVNKVDPVRKLNTLKKYLESVQRSLNVKEAEVAYLTPMSKILATYSEENATASVQQQGKQMYLYNNGSSATMQMRKLVNDRLSQGGFWADNPIIDMFKVKKDSLGLVQHFKLIEKKDGSDKESLYANETTRDYLSRIFNYGFVSKLLNGQKDMLTWFYTISDKPKTLALTTDILNSQEQVEWITKALDQEASIVERKDKLASKKLRQRADSIAANENVPSSFHPSVNVSEYRAANNEEKKKIAIELLNEIRKESSNLVSEMSKINFAHDSELTKAAEAYHALVDFHIGMDESDVIDFKSDSKIAQEYLIKEFYVQQYISKHFVNQLVVGDVNAYKSLVDLIKRMSGPFAPGTKPHFTESTTSYKVAVIDDVEFEYNDYTDPTGFFEQVHGLDFEVTDAQQYRNENFKDMISNSMGSAADVGFIDKPVYFHVNENGEPTYFKTAVITLTNALNKAFKKASILSEHMDNMGVSEVVTHSGTKAGNPETNGDSTVATSAESTFNMDNSTPLEVSTEGYLQQLSTTSKIGASGVVSAPSQLIYLLQNNAGVNQERAQMIYQDLASIIKDRIASESESMIKEGQVDKTTMSSLLKRMTKDDEVVGIIYDLLNSSAIGEDALNMQGIADKIESLLLSKMYKNIQEIRFKGMKMQLISADLFEVIEIGDKILTYDKLRENSTKKAEVDNYYDVIKANPELELHVKTMKKHEKAEKLKEFYEKLSELNKKGQEKVDAQNLEIAKKNEEEGTNKPLKVFTPISEEDIKQFEGKTVPRDLVYNTEDGYAEVIMPNGYKGMSNEELLNSEELSKGFGFRLPSTEMHSSIAVRVVAVYDEGGQTTPIIAPKEIVLFHGSDNDADTLNVLQYETHKGEPKKINDKLTYKKGDILGKVLSYDEEISILDEAIKNATKGKRALQKIKEEVHKNRIVETFMDVVRDPKNKEEMLEPISFGPIVKKEHENSKQLAIDVADYEARGTKFVNDPKIETFRKLNAISGAIVTASKGSPNSVTNDLAFMKANNEGKELVGFYANGGKAVYMNINKEGETELSELSKPIELFGIDFKKFQSYEKFGNKNGLKVSLLHDIYVNLATDNAKEQRLDVLNQNKHTASVAVLQTRLGIPMIYQAIMANSPAVKALTEVYKDADSVNPGNMSVAGLRIKAFGKKGIYSEVLKAIAGEGFKPSSITLEDALSIHGKSLEQMTKEEREVAANVLASFHKFENLAEDMRNVMKATSGMNSSHKNLGSIDSSLEAFDKLKEKKFPFKNEMNSVPHIAAHKEYLEFTKKVIEGTLLFKSESFRKAIDSMVTAFKIDRSSDTALAQFKADIEQFLVASMPSLEKYKNGEFTSKGEVLYSTDAFLQSFSKELMEYRVSADAMALPEASKKYLAKLSTVSKFIAGKRKGDWKKISFNGRSLKGIDVELAKLGIEHIMESNPQLGEKIKAYVTLEYGLRIMNNSFTRFMPVNSFQGVVNFLSNEGESMTSRFSNTDTFVPQLFSLQYLANNFKSKPSASFKEAGNGVKYVEGVIKPAFKVKGDIYTLAREVNGVGFYIQASKPSDTSYDMSQLGENLDTRHALSIRHITVENMSDIQIRTTLNSLKEKLPMTGGTIFGVSQKGEPLRKGEKYIQMSGESVNFEFVSADIVREATRASDESIVKKFTKDEKVIKGSEDYVKSKESAQEQAEKCN